MTTGIISPSWSFPEVLALNALQNSMRFTPCWPRAGPTGGAGVALPAETWSLTTAETLFAISPSSLLPVRCGVRQGSGTAIRRPRTFCLGLLHLIKIQLHGRRATENGDHHAERRAIVVDFVHDAREVLEGAVGDLDVLPFIEHQFRLGMFRSHFHAVNDPVHFLDRQRARLLARTYEPRNAGSGTHQVPGVVVQIHLHQDVPRVEKLRRHDLFPAPHFNNVFGRDHDLAKLRLQSGRLDPALQSLRHLLFEARIGVNDVPALSHDLVARFRQEFLLTSGAEAPLIISCARKTPGLSPPGVKTTGRRSKNKGRREKSSGSP